MAILNRDEFFETISTIYADRTDDESIKTMENLTDTYDDLANRANGDGVDWKTKYEELDKSWKEKYKNRFFSGNVGNGGNFTKPNEDSTEGEKTDITIDDLFT